jgi:hypothetical protein
VVTFNTLISKAPDYAAAEGWYEKMAPAGVLPDVVTFNTLISKAPDYAAAEGCAQRMRDVALVVNSQICCTVLSRSLAGESAAAVLAWFLAQECESLEPIQAAIKAFRRAGQVTDSLWLALKYPLLQAAQSAIGRHLGEAERTLSEMPDADPRLLRASCVVAVHLVARGRLTCIMHERRGGKRGNASGARRMRV